MAIVAAFPLAFLVAIASLGGLLIPSLYSRESANWAAQAVSQDWIDLVLAVPWLIVTAVFALRGSRRGLMLLAGGQLYTVYTFVLYALGMHFNALFLVYCGALGISFFGLVGIAVSLWGDEEDRWPFKTLPTRTAGSFLIAMGLLFGAAWLGEIVPAIVLGTTPESIVEAGTFTNPVYVIDLSVVLPLHLAAGVALLRRRRVGSVLAPVVLAFGVLMALSIACMIVLMRYQGIAASLGVAAGMTLIAMASAVVLGLLLHGRSAAA
jgi:hypothetical protein